MVSAVQLGNFFSVNGKLVSGGAGGSGINTQDMIAALVKAKEAPKIDKENAIKLNDSQATALQKLQQLISVFKTANDALRNPPGVGNEANNAFKLTTGSVSSNGSSYLSVTTQPGAALQSYIVNNITQLASAANQTTGTLTVATADTTGIVAATSTAGKFKAGTLDFGGGATITLTTSDTLNTIAAKFNAIKDTTGIGATVIQVSSGSFKLQFTSTETGTDANFDLTNATTVADTAGVLSNIGLGTQATQNSGIFNIADADSTIVSAGDLGAGNQFAPGTITFLGGATVTLNEGDSLNTVAGAFNAQSAATGITATVVEDAPGQFHLAFKAVRPGASNNFDLNGATVTGGASVLAGAGIGAATGGTTTTLTNGTNAIFKLNGVSIQRQSNDIDDVINGVTFTLEQITSLDDTTNANITVNVKPDITTVKNSINLFINAFNDLKVFAAQQTALKSDGTYADEAVLATNQTFITTMNTINQQVTAQVSGLSGLNNLANLGITLSTQPATGDTPEVQNILTIDDNELASTLATNFQGVSKLFGFTLTSDSTNLQVFSHTNALAASSFTLNIDPTAPPGVGTFTATYNLGAGPVTVSLTKTLLSGGAGYKLEGQVGTALEGLVLVYGSTAASTIHVTATQGIADTLYNTSATAITPTTGTIPVALKALADSDTQLNKDITDLGDQIAVYQQQLIFKFAALEAAVAKVNSLLTSIGAQDQARNAQLNG